MDYFAFCMRLAEKRLLLSTLKYDFAHRPTAVVRTQKKLPGSLKAFWATASQRPVLTVNPMGEGERRDFF